MRSRVALPAFYGLVLGHLGFARPDVEYQHRASWSMTYDSRAVFSIKGSAAGVVVGASGLVGSTALFLALRILVVLERPGRRRSGSDGRRAV